MKSVAQLFEQYPFEKARRDLFNLIEDNFNDKKCETTIPAMIVKSFSLNVDKTKKLFEEMKEQGYVIHFSNKDSIIIKVINEDNVGLALLLNRSNFSTMLDDKNIIEMVFELIKKYPDCWRKNGAYGGTKDQNIYMYKSNDQEDDSAYISINLDKRTLSYNHDLKIELKDSETYILSKSLQNIKIKEKDTLINVGSRFKRQKKTVEEIIVESLKKELSK